MTAIRLGLRYERLLFLAGPISLISLLVLFIAIASDTHEERRQARCLWQGANVLEQSQTILDAEWGRQRLLIDSQQGSDYRYTLALTKEWIFGLEAGSGCYEYFNSLPSNDLFSSPEVLIAKFRREAEIPIRTPIRYFGIQIPDEATFSVFGTNIKMELMTLTKMLQVGLAPILLLWLGSLYNTRFREIKLIAAATNITQVFPHIINFYPVGIFMPLRKKSKMRYYWPSVLAFVYFLIRASLIIVFVGPPVAFYMLSLDYLYSLQYQFLFFGVGALITIFGLANILGEITVSLFWKTFPSPYIIG